MSAPTTVCVVETGNPRLVPRMSQKALPTSAQPIANIKAPGEALKAINGDDAVLDGRGDSRT